MSLPAISSSSRVNKALYTKGQDNRQNLCDVNGLNNIKTQAQSVACLMKDHCLVKNGNSYVLQNAPPLHARFPSPLAPSVKFRDEPVAGKGTAFLVGDKLVLTAGHCVWNFGRWDADKSEVNLTKIRAVFGFHMQNSNHLAPIDKAMVCKIAKIVAGNRVQDGRTGADWALVELKKHPAGLIPLRIDFINKIEHPLKIYMLGHPIGLPLKYVEGAVAKPTDDPNNSFEAEIDAFGGNSGSPVFNSTTNKVIGILVRGNEDFDIGLFSTHLHYVTIKERLAAGYEVCQRTSTNPQIIPLIDDGFYKNESAKSLKLGLDSYHGRAVSQDFKKAIQRYEEALVLDPTNAETHYELGYCYLWGMGINKDPERAAYYFKRSIALAPNPVGVIYWLADAQYGLGYCYFHGLGVKKDNKQAIHHFNESIKLNPQHKAALRFLSGEDVFPTESPVSYLEELIKLRPNDANPRAYLGECLYRTSTQFTDDSYKRAFDLLKKATELDPTHARAHHFLGECYKGYGTSKNLVEAFNSFNKAFNLGYHRSLWDIAYCYIYGEGVEKDIHRGYEMLRKYKHEASPKCKTDESTGILAEAFEYTYIPHITHKFFSLFGGH